MPWCRKCRRFSKTFFVEEREAVVRKQQNIGLLWAKLRMFCFKSTDVFIKEVRCFCIPERRFHNLNVSLSERRGQTCGLCWARETKAKLPTLFPMSPSWSIDVMPKQIPEHGKGFWRRKSGKPSGFYKHKKNEVFLLDDSEESRIFAAIYEIHIMKEKLFALLLSLTGSALQWGRTAPSNRR